MMNKRRYNAQWYILKNVLIIFSIILIIFNTGAAPSPTSGEGRPDVDIDIKVHLNKIDGYVGDVVELIYTISNNNKENEANFRLIDNITTCCEVSVNNTDIYIDKVKNELSINVSLGKKESKNYIINLTITPSCGFGKHPVISPAKFIKQNVARTSPGEQNYPPIIKYNKDEEKIALRISNQKKYNIELNNNGLNFIPILNITQSLEKPFVHQSNDSLIFILAGSELDITALTTINSYGINYSFIWYEIPTNINFSIAPGQSKVMSIQIPTMYRYEVEAYHNRKIMSDRKNAIIFYNGSEYSSFIVTNEGVKKRTVYVLMIFIVALFAISIIFKFVPPENPILTRLLNNVYYKYIIFIIPIIFVCFPFYISIIYPTLVSFNEDLYEAPLIVRSWEYLLLTIFIIIFIFVIFFGEVCFAQYEGVSSGSKTFQLKSDPKNPLNRPCPIKLFIWFSPKLSNINKRLRVLRESIKQLTINLWLYNLIGMSSFLISSILFLPSIIDKDLYCANHFQGYYNSISQIFGTILAIIAGFYTILPYSNILSVDQKKNKIAYATPTLLKRFIIIFGILIVLSLWGLTFGIDFSVDMYPKIQINTLNAFIASIIKLSPLIVFEVTLLLIPPAFSWLYALLHVSSFTGSALIECHPKLVEKAEICINGMKTGLYAPNRITLKKGEYKISLKKDYWDSSDIDITIEPGTENRYIIHIAQTSYSVYTKINWP